MYLGKAGPVLQSVVVIAVMIPSVRLSRAQTIATDRKRPSSSPDANTTGDNVLVSSLRLLKPEEITPLTNKMRLRSYVKSVFAPGPVLAAAAGYGFSQWRDSPREWRQGGTRYGGRFANHFSFNAVRQTISFGTAAFLREDNRYFASGKQSVALRIAYAITATVMSHQGDQNRHLSISSVSGIVGATLISRIWSPPSWQGARNIGKSIGITFAATAGFNVAREFVPGLIRRFQKR